jgi:DNA-binding NarL/FixJ family response regulator
MANRVLTLYCNGFSIRQIAERLDLEVEDVQMYLRLFRD